MYVMLFPLIQSLGAAPKLGRNSLVSEFVSPNCCLLWREQTKAMPSHSLCDFFCFCFFPICSGCNLLSQCCNTYEYCVSCCLNPALVISHLLFALLFFSLFPFPEGLSVHGINWLNRLVRNTYWRRRLPNLLLQVMFPSYYFAICLVVCLCLEPWINWPIALTS